MSLRYKFAIFVAICALINIPISGQGKQDQKDILGRANRTYYALKENGFNGFRCSADPNWKKYIEENFNGYNRDFPPLNLLSQLSFAVSVEKDGAVKVEPLTLDKGEIDIRIRQDAGGLLQVITGFYQTWAAFAISTPFPDANENVILKAEGNGYRILSNDGSESEIDMSKDFLISQMSVLASGSKVIMWPKYVKTDKGLLMTSIDSDIGNGQMKVSFDIRYQEIDGLKLPSSIVYRLVAPGHRVNVDIALTKCQLTKR
jgi:hypothetical protein